MSTSASGSAAGFTAHLVQDAVTASAVFDAITETDVKTDGTKTLVFTLVGDTLESGATFDAQRQSFINNSGNGFVNEFGWDEEVINNEVVTAIVRTSSTVLTWTLSAIAAYSIDADDTDIAFSFPAGMLVVSSVGVAVTEKLTITADGGTTIPPQSLLLMGAGM